MKNLLRILKNFFCKKKIFTYSNISYRNFSTEEIEKAIKEMKEVDEQIIQERKQLKLF